MKDALKIHILGICGTFMGGIALLAREAGFAVSGSDANVYPPMSTQLQEQGINLCEGYALEDIPEDTDQVVIGNALSRGNAAVEGVLEQSLPYTSGPQWLYENVLRDQWVLAVAGTHGKTTTSSMLAWILEYAGLQPGFLIGGVPGNFGLSARYGGGQYFVVEADEYDTAFFDKRSKFVHYHPRTLILNNLEFDHADIFDDLAAIQKQFHHLLRTVPASGRVIVNDSEPALDEVINMGLWSERVNFGQLDTSHWQATKLTDAYDSFDVSCQLDAISGGMSGCITARLDWTLIGQHNMYNALAAVAAAHHVGVDVATSVEALTKFQGVKRRLEIRGIVKGVTVYDDFAHHPTAITLTLDGLRAKVGTERIFAVLEPRSNTMRMGIHQDELALSLHQADQVLLFEPDDLGWNLSDIAAACENPANVYNSIEQIIETLMAEIHEGDHVLLMSNGAFGGIHDKLMTKLQAA